MVCRDIVSKTDCFRQVLIKLTRHDYHELIHIYCNIISIVEYCDSKVGSFVFILVIYNDSSMYYGLTLILNNDVEVGVKFYKIAFAWFLNCVNFIIRVKYASRIHSLTVLIKYESRNIHSGSDILDSFYMRVLLNCL